MDISSITCSNYLRLAHHSNSCECYILITLTKSLAIAVGFVVLVCCISFSAYHLGVQNVSAQNNDQFFKDCRSKILEVGNKMSEVGDRAPYEDVRTEASALMTEMLVVLSDCEAVKDRLTQDPAVQFLMEYLSSQNQ